jgi:hypothetical protein
MLPQALRSGPRAAALATLAVFAAAPLPAQTPAAAPLVVTVAPVTLTPGGKAEAKVTLEILRGVRIIAPGSEGKFLQPAQLAFNAADGVFVEPPAWPDPKVWHAEPDDPPIKVFEGKIQFTVTVHAGPKVQAQELMLQGRLRYQPIVMDDYQKAATLEVRMPVTVTAAPAEAPQPKAKAKAKGTAATRP